jgi:ribonuclease P protein component
MDTLRHYSRKMIDEVVRSGKRVKFNGGFAVAKNVTANQLGKEVFNKMKHPFIISVTKKVDSRSVVRNKIRRQLKPTIVEIESVLKESGHFCLIVIREKFTNIDSLRDDITTFIRSMATQVSH